MSAQPSALPIIDLAELDNESTRQNFYDKLGYMARDIGFFYLVGHGIDPKEREDLLASAKKFFALPQEVKDKYDMANSRHFRGYTKSGSEVTRKKRDFREQLDIGYECDPVPNISDDELWLNLIGPNQWPEEVPELRERALDYQTKLRRVAIRLLHAFMVALGQKEDVLDDLLSDVPQHLLKLVRYPPNLGDDAEGDGNAKQQGCGAHRDVDVLTLLWQDDIGGLQVETEKGWIDIPSVENAFVINIGETLEVCTGGYLRANVHQVVRPISNRSRYSIPFFLSTNLRAKEIPLLELPPALKARARGESVDPMNPLFHGSGKNLIKSRLRSHLAVTERFYPEIYKTIVKTGNLA